MRTNGSAIRSFILLLMLTSCVEPIVMDPEEDMPVVVHCVLTRDLAMESSNKEYIPVQSLNLFYAKSISDNGDYKMITDAKVNVSGDGNSYDFLWNGDVWECCFTPSFGATYTLTVRLNNGKVITSKTSFPKSVAFTREPLFTAWGSYYTIAHYLSCPVSDDDIYMWCCAPKGREFELTHFCTNHPGADNFNLSDKSLAELPVFDQMITDLKTSLDYYKKDEASNRALFEDYLSLCATLPTHAGFVRIHHNKDLESLLPDYLVRKYNFQGNYEDRMIHNGYVLFTDFVTYIPNYIPMMLIVPIQINIVSKEYDTYLRNLANNNLHYDELNNNYSMDLSYTNIDGGIGIFGSRWY